MCALNIGKCIKKSSSWLVDIQNNEDGGWGQYKGANSNSLNTAEAILALIETGHCRAGDVIIKNGVKYLVSHQLNERNYRVKRDYGAWPKDVTAKDGRLIFKPDTIRTSLALLALNAAGASLNDNVISTGVRWLVGTQNDDGGWGYKSNHQSWLFPTCLALKTLIRIYSAGDRTLEDTISKGLKHLSSYRNEGGSFGKQPGLEASHTLHTINTLKLAESQGFSFDEDYILDAMDWVQKNTNQILRWGNETILIGRSQNSPDNYTFSHINPALYLAIVGQNLTPQDDIAKEALIVIYDNMDYFSNGFCAKRSVSWATANTIAGLLPSKTVFTDFPERQSTPTRLGGRQWVFFLLAALSIASTTLTFAGKFSVTYASFSFAIILATLLVYGFISEGTFLKLLLNKRALKRKMLKGS